MPQPTDDRAKPLGWIKKVVNLKKRNGESEGFTKVKSLAQCFKYIFLALDDNSDPQDFLNPSAMTVQKLVKHRLDEKSQ